MSIQRKYLSPISTTFTIQFNKFDTKSVLYVIYFTLQLGQQEGQGVVIQCITRGAAISNIFENFFL